MDLVRRAIMGSLVVGLLAPSMGVAAEKSVEEILECQLRTRPLTNTVRNVLLRRIDRIGGETVYGTKVYGGTSREGYRTLLIQVTRPEGVARPLVHDHRARRREPHVHLSGGPARRQAGARRLPADGVSSAPTSPTRTSSGSTGSRGPGRRIRWWEETARSTVVPSGSSRRSPPTEAGSAYWKIVSHVDRETCVLLRAEMYELGDSPRKIMTADPASISKEGKVWVVHDVLVRDLRDETLTHMVLNELELGVKNEDVPFTPEELAQYKRSRTKK